MTRTRDEQLEWETRAGRLAAAAAILAALCLVGATIYLQAAITETADGTDEVLKLVDAHGSEFVVSGVIQGLGLLLLVPVLGYLYRATRFRRPETPRLVLILLVAGPVLAAVIGVIRQIEFVDIAGEFVAGSPVSGAAGETRGDDLIDDSSLPVIGGVGFGANLALGFAVVLLSLNAMRAGLTSRFLGIVGIIIGVLYALPVVAGGPQIVQLFWLGALAAIFLGRWPGGRGPAWAAGEAVQWPTAAQQAQLREQELAAPGAGTGSGNGRGSGEELESADPDVPRPRSRKRKRKR